MNKQKAEHHSHVHPANAKFKIQQDQRIISKIIGKWRKQIVQSFEQYWNQTDPIDNIRIEDKSRMLRWIKSYAIRFRGRTQINKNLIKIRVAARPSGKTEKVFRISNLLKKKLNHSNWTITALSLIVRQIVAVN